MTGFECFICSKFKFFQLFFTDKISFRITRPIVPVCLFGCSSSKARHGTVLGTIHIVGLILLPALVVHHRSISPEESIQIVLVSSCSNPEPGVDSRSHLTLVELSQELIFFFGVNGDQVRLVSVIKQIRHQALIAIMSVL